MGGIPPLFAGYGSWRWLKRHHRLTLTFLLLRFVDFGTQWLLLRPLLCSLLLCWYVFFSTFMQSVQVLWNRACFSGTFQRHLMVSAHLCVWVFVRVCVFSMREWFLVNSAFICVILIWFIRKHTFSGWKNSTYFCLILLLLISDFSQPSMPLPAISGVYRGNCCCASTNIAALRDMVRCRRL